MNIMTIQTQAMQLNSAERAALAAHLLLSLDDLPEVEVEQLWLAQATRRAREIDQGQVALISAEQVQREAHALCR